MAPTVAITEGAAGGGGGGFSWLLSTTSFGSRQRLGRSLLRLHMLIDQPAAPAPVSSHLLGDADDSGANGASAAAVPASSSNGVLPVSPAANGTASGHLWGRLGSGDGADAGRKVAWRSRPAEIQLGLAELSLDAAAPSHVTHELTLDERCGRPRTHRADGDYPVCAAAWRAASRRHTSWRC